MSRIRLSPNHGVNPAIPLCFFCNKPKNEIILTGRLPGDAEAPQHAVWNTEPCDECQEFMKQGIICISVRADSDPKNPYRTGGWWVLREEAFARIFSGSEAEEALKRRVAFLEDAVCQAVGLTQ